jgi:hypothetical protein
MPRKSPSLDRTGAAQHPRSPCRSAASRYGAHSTSRATSELAYFPSISARAHSAAASVRIRGATASAKSGGRFGATFFSVPSCSSISDATTPGTCRSAIRHSRSNTLSTGWCRATISSTSRRSSSNHSACLRWVMSSNWETK